MAKLLIGWGEESLVPAKKVRLAGQFYERISQYVESEITATAMAVEADGEAMIMVSADLTSVPVYVLELVREKLARKRFTLLSIPDVISASQRVINFSTSSPASNRSRRTAESVTTSSAKIIGRKWRKTSF